MVKKRYPNKRIVYIPNGVARPVPTLGTSVLQEFHLTPQQYILAVARFVPEKGLHDLIAAFEKVRADLPRLVIVGSANHETAYSRLLRKTAKNIQGVMLTGTVRRCKLYDLYAYTRLFVLPSHYEGLPIALLEAISCGAPVLASDIEANRELMLPSYRYFATGNREMLAQKMVELCNTHVPPSERTATQQRITETYSWDRIATAICAVYRELCAVHT
jgi:glycosyltransferase involved in cell wall biosynthesis